MGGEEMSQNYQQDLDNEVIELYRKETKAKISFDFVFFIWISLVNYKKHNDSKNVFAFSRTPTTFILSMVLCYLIAGILDTIWLGGINFIFMFAFWMCFVLLSLWLYTKYSGEYAEIGEYIDYFADVIWNNVRKRREWIKDWIAFFLLKGFQPVYSKCLRSAMRSVLGQTRLDWNC